MKEVMESEGNGQMAASWEVSLVSIFMFQSNEQNVLSTVSDSLKLSCRKGKNADESCHGNLSPPHPTPSSRHCRLRTPCDLAYSIQSKSLTP